jgi:hypothetical protein
MESKETGKKKHPGGRPSKYDPSILEDIPEMFRNGESIEEVCRDKLKISKQTCYNWMKEHPEFLDSIKQGLGLSEAWWHTLGRAGASGKAPINPAVWIFNMKNRFGWSDKMDSNLNIGDQAGEKVDILGVISKVRKELSDES